MFALSSSQFFFILRSCFVKQVKEMYCNAIVLLRFSITCGLYNSNLNRQMRFRYRQSDVRRFLPASDYCRARGNQIKSSSTVQTT